MLERTTLPGAAVSDLDVLRQALGWLDSGREVAVATVVATWGSSPRPVGSQCVVSDRLELAGSVSGGCVEAAVIRAAQDAIESGTAAGLEFQVADEEAWSVGLACGGRVEIWVDRVVRDGETARAFRAAVAHLGEGGAGVATIPLFEGETAFLPVGVDGRPSANSEGSHGGLVEAAVQDDRSRTFETPDGPVLLRVYNPPPRLVIVGAVHIAQTLATMARVSGLDVTVVDPRSVFANEDRFPGVRLELAWPDEAFERIGLDHRTAVVSLSHDPKLDDPALRLAISSPAFYVGALGSRRTHQKRVTRLADQGSSEADLERIASPVGLDIGARTPAEIAVAILSEIVATLRGGSVTGAGG